MRALGTQVRLRRLLRAHAEYVERLAAAPHEPEPATAASRRLLEMIDGLRQSWASETRDALEEPELTTLRSHVSRTLSAMEAAVAMGFDRRATAEFRAAAVPLVFFLRGLEELPEGQVLEWFSPRHLERSA